jgi:hypothetical protein
MKLFETHLSKGPNRCQSIPTKYKEKNLTKKYLKFRKEGTKLFETHLVSKGRNRYLQNKEKKIKKKK